MAWQDSGLSVSDLWKGVEMLSSIDINEWPHNQNTMSFLTWSTWVSIQIWQQFSSDPRVRGVGLDSEGKRHWMIDDIDIDVEQQDEDIYHGLIKVNFHLG